MYLSGSRSLQLVDDVVAHPPRGARRERRDRALREMSPQPAQAAGSPAGIRVPTPKCNAPRRSRKAKPAPAASHSSVSSRASRSGERYSSRYFPSRASRITSDCCDSRQRAIQQRRGDSHLRELRRLILHQRDQRRNHDDGFSRQHRRRQLVAQRFPAAGGHHHAGVASSEQAAHDPLLQRAKRVISPVAAQRRRADQLRRPCKEYRPPADKFLLVPAIRNLASRTSHSSFGSRSIASNAYPWLELAATSAQFNS